MTSLAAGSDDPYDAALDAELRRRLAQSGLTFDPVVRDAGDGDAVMYLHPDAMRLWVPEQHHLPGGVVVRWPAGTMRRFLASVGASATAAKIGRSPGPGRVWAVWIAPGCALASPWSRPS